MSPLKDFPLLPCTNWHIRRNAAGYFTIYIQDLIFKVNLNIYIAHFFFNSWSYSIHICIALTFLPVSLIFKEKLLVLCNQWWFQRKLNLVDKSLEPPMGARCVRRYVFRLNINFQVHCTQLWYSTLLQGLCCAKAFLEYPSKSESTPTGGRSISDCNNLIKFYSKI